MHELVLTRKDKASRYEELLPQIRSLIAGETDLTANLANVSAALHEAFDFFWVGFYLVDDTRNELVLGPFQGPVACARIGYGKGVCGTAWKEGRSVVVEDVEAFPGHIACSSKSRSEIVVPVFDDGGRVLGVLDIDSVFLSAFDEVDRHYLEMLCRIICESAK
ncbi:MAG TPA: GAF domain-containing protein [Candidatus Coprenecus stercoravium]|uniref:GAF domain-containing protein n=1 Tax=Candidatus Coprenecus stercoravium TaxID=2840735 RepID=A0A9D2GPF1_9BACT|nr:GAF domain-containing protein [Candidatus Coprenecus stercoravium]